jgi:hypothetical protein
MVINYINENAAAQAVPEPPAGVLALGGLAVLLVGGGFYGCLRRRRRLAWARVPRRAGHGEAGPGRPDGR